LNLNHGASLVSTGYRLTRIPARQSVGILAWYRLQASIPGAGLQAFFNAFYPPDGHFRRESTD
jgi:hypothetical protein